MNIIFSLKAADFFVGTGGGGPLGNLEESCKTVRTFYFAKSQATPPVSQLSFYDINKGPRHMFSLVRARAPSAQ